MRRTLAGESTPQITRTPLTALLNREAGVIVRNKAVAEYYTEVFLDDWDPAGSNEKGERGEDGGTPTYYLSALFIVGGVIAGIVVRRKKGL